MPDPIHFQLSDKNIDNSRIVHGYSSNGPMLSVMDVTFKDNNDNLLAISEISFTKDELELMLQKMNEIGR